MFKNKKIALAAALISVVALMLTGTFAWQQAISKTNEFFGHKTGVTLHDDFNPDTGAKDIYVENTGSAQVFVRVKLDEAMKLGSNTWRPGTADWSAHTYGSAAEDCGETNADGKRFHDYFQWVMGGRKYYMPSDGTQQVAQDTTNYTGSEPGVRLTPNAQIIKTGDYLAMSSEQQAAFTGWIYDSDGYAYWSQPLGQGEVTGLLLHRVITSPGIKGTDYYYAIDVTTEAVDLADLPMWTSGAASQDGSGATYSTATANGKRVIDILASMAGTGIESASTDIPDVGPAPAEEQDAQPGGNAAVADDPAQDEIPADDAVTDAADAPDVVPAEERPAPQPDDSAAVTEEQTGDGASESKSAVDDGE